MNAKLAKERAPAHRGASASRRKSPARKPASAFPIRNILGVLRSTQNDNPWKVGYTYSSFAVAIAICFTLLAANSSAQSPAASKTFDYKTLIGLVEHIESGGLCLTLANSTLQSGEPITIVVMDNPQKIVKGRVGKKLAKTCAAYPDAGEKAVSYAVQVPGVSQKDIDGSIGIVRFAGKFDLRNGLVHADLARDGSANSFHSCTSEEGVHLTVWSGEPIKSALRWHDYHYLGYDTDADCTDKEMPK